MLRLLTEAELVGLKEYAAALQQEISGTSDPVDDYLASIGRSIDHLVEIVKSKQAEESINVQP